MAGRRFWRKIPAMSAARQLQHSVEKANLWLGELAEQLGDEDRERAYRVLRAYLHALRDRLPVDESAQLAAQLPTLIRGIYYQDWDPSRTPEPYRGFTDFLERMIDEASLDGETSASYATSAAASVLRRHVSAGELEDLLGVLPPDLKPILG